MIQVGTQVTCTMTGRGHWTGEVIGHSGIHGDQLRVRRSNGSVSDWREDQWTPVTTEQTEEQTMSQETWVSTPVEEVRRGSNLGDDGTVTSFTDTPSGRHLTTSLGEILLVPWGQSLTTLGRDK